MADKHEGADMQRYEQEQCENKPDLVPTCETCGADLVWAECHMIDCEDGEYDEYEYDAINYSPGSYMPCGECGGKGGFWVCGDRERHSTAEPRAAAPESLSESRAAAQGEEK